MLKPQDFDFICALLRQHSAIVLEPGKEYLVESRLGPLVRELNLGSISELVQQLRSQPRNGLTARIVEAMVTTETSFFRDHNPFKALQTAILPDLIQRRSGSRELRIWCAACATGQEPYSIALLLREFFPELKDWKVTLLATDISREMITRAREGRFCQLEVNRGLPAAMLARHFQRQGLAWQIDERFREMIDWREMNLAASWPPLPQFDLILLRNVMIYFEIETKKTILERVAHVLRPDGYLLLGAAETTFHINDSFRRVESSRAGFYQLIPFGSASNAVRTL